MANRLVRSVFWLVACGGLGYTCLLLTTPSQEDIDSIKKDLSTAKDKQEHLSKNQKFMNVLISASDNNKPLYRMTKEEIEKELKKN